MKKEMLINVLQAEECRIAILEDGVLEELYVERASHESYVGNIYKGRIVNIEPSIQAAFVDFGVGRNGFLHASDVEPTYYKHLETRYGDRDRMDRGGDRDRMARGDRRGNGRDRDRDRGRDRDRDRDRGRDRDRDREPARPLPAVFSQEVVLDEVLERENVPDTPVAPVAELPAPIVAPAEPLARPEGSAPAVVDDFAAGVDLDAAATVAPPSEDVAAENSAPKKTLTALPETRIEEEPEKPRRRARSSGTPRRRTRAAASSEPPAEQAEPAETEEASRTASESSPVEPAETPKPRLMDSAERRTDKDSDSDPTPGGAVDFDPDLFFPTSHLPAPAPKAPVAEPEEEHESEPAPTPVPARPAAVIEPPPRRPRPPRSHGSIEDALEADLAEAEIGEDETPPEIDLSERLEEPAEPAIEETLPEQLEEPEREFAVESFDREKDLDEREEEFDEDFPRRTSGGDRGRSSGGRDRGRRKPMGGRPGTGRPKPLIQDVFKRGQEVIVQVIKEGIGTKGPTLSTYISIPGRYLVLMPCLNRTGVSRKIEDEDQRRRLRQMFNELKPPAGLGFIMRTAAIDKNKNEVQRDLVYLSRLWQVVVRRIRKTKSPAEIYQESEMVTRTIRDNFSSDIDTIWVDERAAFESAQEFMQVVMPRYADRIKFYEGKEPLFHKFGIEDEIARIQQKKVPLPHGGSIVIDQTEALVAIDVNSGNFRAEGNAEETAYQMNLHAAKEIARQLRLRDLGGVIVNDFIDMRDERHRRNVEKALRDAMRRDRARTKILKISQFGLIEMTRQRVRPSLKRSGYQDCPYCKGMAQVKSPETMSLEAMRLIQLASTREVVQRVEITVASDVADYLLNKKRRDIVALESEGQMSVQIRGVHGAPPELCDFVCLDRNDNEVRLGPPEPVTYRPRR